MKHIGFYYSKNYGEKEIKVSGTALLDENNTLYAPMTFTKEGKTTHFVKEFPSIHKQLQKSEKDSGGYCGRYTVQYEDDQGYLKTDTCFLWVKEYYKA